MQLDQQLLSKEANLNKRIDEKAAEVRNLDNSLLRATEELEGLENEREGVRDLLLDEFFSHHLYPLGFDYRVFEAEDETLIEIISEEDNEHYQKLLAAIGSEDPKALPLIFIFDFIGEGLPFNAGE